MSCTHIDPSIHVVRDTPTAKLFRKLLRFEDILTFFHTGTGNWILAYWVSKSGHLVDEIEDLGPAFELVDANFVDMICRCWKPVNWQEKKKRLIQIERNQLRKQDEAILEQQERYNWLKKRTADKAPMPYAFKSGFSGGDVEAVSVG